MKYGFSPYFIYLFKYILFFGIKSIERKVLYVKLIQTNLSRKRILMKGKIL